MTDQAQTLAQPRVLVVDDDPDGLGELTEGLGLLGVSVLGAATAAEALDLAQSHAGLQVIVTDLQLPGIDGLELLQKLSARRRMSPLAAIVVTGHASLERAVNALRLRVVDFLQKPVTADEVAAAIDRALALLGSAPTQVQPASPGSLHWPDFLRILVAAQADRAAIFEPNPFGDPAWEMMLDLLISEAYGRHISVTSLCFASGAPTTTALRRIDELLEAGFLEKQPDHSDKRRTLVRLTPHGRERMEAFVQRQAGRLSLKLD